MATLEMVRKTENNNTMEQIQQDRLCTEELISPACFGLICNSLNVRDVKFCEIVKMLTKSCTQMNQHSQEIIQRFFLSAEFFNIFVKINKMIDEIWMLRKKHPEMIKEWKWRHRQVFLFRSKLLKFLENKFRRVWVQHFISTAESVRVKVWPLG